ncbi:Dicarboxylic amino acid permease [Neonectria ditissima]|uniref:Dicarboxylic amino acid permease n=1 Tax=Neonectria ditissima TaxID=78410 RepID=A0A0P7B6P2_9HYPO|nr:Dicarboxylic amino acid permease [Neonectria ditissima]
MSSATEHHPLTCRIVTSDAEKGAANRQPSAPQEQQQQQHVRGIETSDETALHRALKARHITMIAIGGALGTGLLLGTGKALAGAGPGAVAISYTLVGFLVYVVMTALGEMAAWLPMSAGFTGYFFKYIIVTPNQITAGAMVLEYWIPRSQLNPGVFVAVFLTAIVLINWLGVRFFGEFEFWLSSFKVLVLVALMLVTVVIAAGGGPDGEARGFRYWRDPGAFAVDDAWDVSPALARFLGVWSTMIVATFAYLGTELVGVTVGEAQNPRKTIPRAIRLTFFRILFFYCLSVFLLGLCVPYDSKDLTFSAGGSSSSTAVVGTSASPFVVAVKLAGFKTLPALVNGSVVVFIFSGATSDLYIASRTLYGLASDGDAPAVFKRTDGRGVPYVALGASSLFGLLAFMTVGDGTKEVFGRFVNMVTIFGLLSWISIAVTHICFLRARRLQGIPDAAMPYVAPFGLWGSYAALASCCTIALTKNFTAFLETPVAWVDVVTGYVGIPVYLVLIFGHKLVTKSKRVRPQDADFYTGKDVIDREEEAFLEEQARKREQKPDSVAARVYRRYLSWLF